MNTLTTTALEAIYTADLTFEITEPTGELLINELGELSFDVAFEVETQYDRDEPEIGYIGGFSVSKVTTTLLRVCDEEGDDVPISASEKREIEKYLNQNLELNCYGYNF